MHPVTEAKRIQLGIGTAHQEHGHNQQTNSRNDLAEADPEFHLTKPARVPDIQQKVGA